MYGGSLSKDDERARRRPRLPPNYSGSPASIQRLRSSTFSLGHGPSHGMDPALIRSKIGPELTDTSSNDHRSKATRIASRSDSRNSGLIWAGKVGAESLMSLPFAFEDRSERLLELASTKGAGWAARTDVTPGSVRGRLRPEHA